jgi:hypothetical protein
MNKIIPAILLMLTGACASLPKGSDSAQVVAANALLPDFETVPTLSDEIPASVSALLRFVELGQGGTVQASVDPVTGLPTASLLIESNDRRQSLALEADGLLVAINSGQRSTVPNQTQLDWTPWHGNGRYVLNLQLLDWQNNRIPSSHAITVNVAGIPENTQTVKSRFIQLYREHFGLNLTSPTFARYNAPDPLAVEASRWVSVAYIGDRLYEIDILDDGSVTSTSYAINSNEGGGFCRPSGVIRMLIVVVDYANTGLDPQDVEVGLQNGLEDAQRDWVDYFRQAGLPGPILEVELSTFIYGAPPEAGRYLTSEEIRSASGLDPADFDLLVEIDLDKENTTTGQYGGLGVSLGDGCRPLGARQVNIGFNVRDLNSLQNAMPVSVFEHEFMHGMGWMHWWPNQSGNGLSWLNSRTGWEPYMLFGWTDVDGDGLIEIQDPTPYGLIP